MSAGLAVAHADSAQVEDLAQQLRAGLDGEEPALVLFFASGSLDFPSVAAGLRAAFPNSLSVGCTTCGEIGPRGCTHGALVALALAPPARAEAALIEEVGERAYERAVTHVEELDSHFADAPAEDRVLISLTDGLSGAEELLLAAVAAAAPKVALAGGSAADDFRFEATQVAVDGRVATGAAVLLMLAPRRPFAPFHLHHYERGGEPVIVTGADPPRRLVTRINGFPAVAQIAELFGLDEAAMREDPQTTLAQAVFGFSLGGKLFLRSVMKVEGEALLMGGAIEEGTLLYPMAAGDLVAATRAGLEAAIASVREPAGLLLFNCGGRLWEATAGERVDELAEAMLPLPGAGFSTYGEQFAGLQINHTLTGLVFGRGDG